MLEMIENTWKKAKAYRVELGLSGLGVLGLATLAVVFPPALMPMLYTFAAAVIGTALFAAGKFIASFFTKSENKAGGEIKAAEEIKSVETTVYESSTAKTNAALNKATVTETVKKEAKQEVASNDEIEKIEKIEKIEEIEEIQIASFNFR